MGLSALFLQTLEITLPVFAMVFIGLGLKRARWIDPGFVSTASQLVFKATLPTLVFLSIIRADLEASLDPALLGFYALATLASVLFCWGWASLRVPYRERGVYIQGAFRGNCGIVGLALAAGMYGDVGLSTGSLLLGVVILTYNACSVIVLVAYQQDRQQEQRADWRSMLRHIVTNPLILAVAAAVPVAASGWSLPGWLATSGDYFASLTLPLALICIGATLSFGEVRHSGRLALGASLLKMVTLPALTTGAAWLVGFEGPALGVMFLFFSSPTAAAAFVMAKAMGANAALTANIVALTTLMASLTITLGAFGLTAAGVM